MYALYRNIYAVCFVVEGCLSIIGTYYVDHESGLEECDTGGGDKVKGL